MHARMRRAWHEEARKNWDALADDAARLAHEVWDAIKDEDWVLTASTLKDWARKLWNFDRPIAIPAAISAPARRSACRSASRSRTRARAASSSTSSPTAI